MKENIQVEVRSRIGESSDVYGIHARKNGRIVAHVYGQLNLDRAVLESVYVEACERGTGIGSILLAKFVECMMAEGVIEITGEMKTEYGLHIDDTRRFYEKNGFQVDSNSIIRKTL